MQNFCSIPCISSMQTCAAIRLEKKVHSPGETIAIQAIRLRAASTMPATTSNLVRQKASLLPRWDGLITSSRISLTKLEQPIILKLLPIISVISLKLPQHWMPMVLSASSFTRSTLTVTTALGVHRKAWQVEPILDKMSIELQAVPVTLQLNMQLPWHKITSILAIRKI